MLADFDWCVVSIASAAVPVGRAGTARGSGGSFLIFCWWMRTAAVAVVDIKTPGRMAIKPSRGPPPQLDAAAPLQSGNDLRPLAAGRLGVDQGILVQQLHRLETTLTTPSTAAPPRPGRCAQPKLGAALLRTPDKPDVHPYFRPPLIAQGNDRPMNHNDRSMRTLPEPRLRGSQSYEKTRIYLT